MIREYTQIGDAVAATMEHNARLADGYWARRADGDEDYEDFGGQPVPDDYCPFHPAGGCQVEDHFPKESSRD